MRLGKKAFIVSGTVGHLKGEVSLMNLDTRDDKDILNVELPTDWEDFFDSDLSDSNVHVNSISDGYFKCLNNLRCVDIEYISYITGKDCETVIKKLRGTIYQNPEKWNGNFYKGWESAEEYLSGNVRRKLIAAMEASEKYNGYFDANVEALKKVLPPGVSARNIYITLGSPWVPAKIIEDFICYLLKESRDIWTKYEVVHDEMTGSWDFKWNYKFTYFIPYSVKEKFGTSRRSVFDIMLRTLNQQSIVVTDTVNCDYTKSGKKSVVNKEETMLALERQQLLIKEFQEWVWKDKERRDYLVGIYEECFASIKQRHFDGSFLELPGLNPSVNLYPYQKNAVARILFSPNTLLAHDVGSGKTYVMIAAGMELKRLGASDKNLYVVPNNIVGQWREIFTTMYPDAHIRCIEPKDFTPAKIEAALEDIRDNDYDAIIMAYSCFSKIPISNENRIARLEKEKVRLRKTQINRSKNTQKLRNRIQKVVDQINELRLADEVDSICFDKLGITRLFVDEAHNFKNVPIDTKVEHVMGISATGSAKCKDMMDKVAIVQSQNAGAGVVMATGTPITNSITDAYIMQQYLQNAELSIIGLQNFDSWIGMFAEKVTTFEIDVDTSNYRMATRFAKFHNIPELTTMLATVSDFHSMEDADGIPEHDGYIDVTVKKTKDFSDYLKSISERADIVRNGLIKRTDDNMLKITTDGRKAALDIRLVGDKYGFTTFSKVFMCAENVSRIYHETKEASLTQLVFCDTSTPKDGFNIYDELKGLLIRMGVKSEEIAYIHDATTDRKREKMFKDMRNGVIRVLLGSTFKLGLGVNVQNKLVSLHHLDVPWRPADMVQREGRILRQFNENSKVEIYRYITEGSFDAYSWQLLETKQRFISDLLSGTATQRNAADVDDTVLNYAEVKALAVGNPLIKERVEVANELSRYMILQQKLEARRVIYQQELLELPEKIEKLEKLIPLVKADAKYYADNKVEYSSDDRRDIRMSVFEASHTEEPTKEESVVANYQGFDIVVAEHSSNMYPVVFLRKNSQYRIELGSSDIGGLTRIDRCLADLENRHKDLASKLRKIEERELFMKKELVKDIDYEYDIQRCREHLAELDDRLGVNND